MNDHRAGQEGLRRIRPVRRGRGRGFTLVELLVIIAILSLLLCILTPSLQKARMLARSMLCMTQVRQINMATAVYCHDHNGFLPDNRWVMPRGILEFYGYSVDQTIPYYLDEGFWEIGGFTPWYFHCPDLSDAEANRGPYWGLTYGYNRQLYNLHTAAVPKPSETLFFADAVGYIIWDYGSVGDCFTGRHGGEPEPTGSRLEFTVPRPTNIGFGDSHCEFRTVSTAEAAVNLLLVKK